MIRKWYMGDGAPELEQRIVGTRKAIDATIDALAYRIDFKKTASCSTTSLPRRSMTIRGPDASRVDDVPGASPGRGLVAARLVD